MSDTVWYVGNADGTVMVSADVDERRLEVDGEIGWGYYGDGAANLARALLADAIRVPVSDEEVSEFKAAVIAELPLRRGWSMTRDSVVTWHRNWVFGGGKVPEPKAPAPYVPTCNTTIF